MKPPTPRQCRNGWLHALAVAGRKLDSVDTRRMAVDRLDAEGRAEVGAFLEALVGRLGAIQTALAEVEADAQAVLVARRELRAEADARGASRVKRTVQP